MPADNALSETVVFEFRNQTGVERLCEQLRLRWFVGVHDCGDIVFVPAELRPEEGDLAALLRSVDGRAYVLEPDPASSRAAAA